MSAQLVCKQKGELLCQSGVLLPGLPLRRLGHACLRWIEVPEAPESGFDAADFEGD